MPPPVARRPQLVLEVAAIYATHWGTRFDGHHGYQLDDSRVVFLPKLGAGFGIRPTAGVLFDHVLSNISALVAVNVEWSRHSAAAYNAGNAPYDRDTSTFVNSSLELRTILEVASIKPYISLLPGYGWLSLPGGITVVDPTTSNTTWQNVTLRGFSFEAQLGAMYQYNELLSAKLGVGYRLNGYNSSSAGGSLSGLGLSAGLVAQLGVGLSF